MDKQKKAELVILKREKKIREARKSFWSFCKILEPDFYKDDRTFLRDMCHTLQSLYDGTLINPKTEKPYRKLMINMPPRHGKSRTLVNFTRWLLGVDRTNKIITASYNDDMATDFSRYCRDGIKEEKNNPTDFVYSDIFPESQIKDGNASIQQWALEGTFFSYKGVGLGSGVTGKGANILISDDLVKDFETAVNESALDKIWRWYTGTFISRMESNAIEIMNMTRWAKGDPCGRILDSEDADLWYVLKLEAYNEETDTMLCEDLLSKEDYLYKSRNIDSLAFRANYHQEPVDQKGSLYKQLKEYDPVDVPEFEEIISYTDTADLGSDWLCSIVGGKYAGEIYILDILYTKDGMEVTEPQTAELLFKNDVRDATIESNNGGRGFARNVERLLWEKFQTRRVHIEWFHQSKNKKARILTNSKYIMDHVYFPLGWQTRWKEFARDILAYQKEGKNKHDDCADALTGLAELMTESKKAVASANPFRKRVKR